MPNRTPEKDLIEQFMGHARSHPDADVRLQQLINADCKSRNLADVEYVSGTGLHWVIEAKTDDSKDRYNTVHKIFGEILKETGRTNPANCRHAVLIPQTALGSYKGAFRCVAKDKFLDFGRLIPIDTVFLSGSTAVTRISWEDLYGEC